MIVPIIKARVNVEKFFSDVKPDKIRKMAVNKEWAMAISWIMSPYLGRCVETKP